MLKSRIHKTVQKTKTSGSMLGKSSTLVTAASPEECRPRHLSVTDNVTLVRAMYRQARAELAHQQQCTRPSSAPPSGRSLKRYADAVRKSSSAIKQQHLIVQFWQECVPDRGVHSERTPAGATPSETKPAASDEEVKMSWATRKMRMSLLHVDVPQNIADVGAALRNLQAIALLAKDIKVSLADLHNICAKLLQKHDELAELLQTSHNDYALRLQGEIARLVHVLRATARERNSGGLQKEQTADAAASKQEKRSKVSASGEKILDAVCFVAAAKEEAHSSAAVSAQMGQSIKDAVESAMQAAAVVSAPMGWSINDAVESAMEAFTQDMHDLTSRQSPLVHAVFSPTSPKEPHSAGHPFNGRYIRPATYRSSHEKTDSSTFSHSGESDSAQDEEDAAPDCTNCSEAQSVERESPKRLTPSPPTSPSSNTLNPVRARLRYTERSRSKNSSRHEISATLLTSSRPCGLQKVLSDSLVSANPSVIDLTLEEQRSPNGTGYTPTILPQSPSKHCSLRPQGYLRPLLLSASVDICSPPSAIFATASLDDLELCSPPNAIFATASLDDLQPQPSTNCRSSSLPPISPRLPSECFATYCGETRHAAMSKQWHAIRPQNQLDLAVLVGRA